MNYTKKFGLLIASAVAVFFTTQFLSAQIVGPPVFTPQMTVSPGFLTVTTGPTSVQDLTINGTCTGCVGAANFQNPTGTIGLTPVNGVAATGIRSDGAPALSQAIVPTWSGIHTFNAIPLFNGGTSGVSAPFSVDSTFVVTNLNADLLDGINSTGFCQTGGTGCPGGVTGFANPTASLGLTAVNGSAVTAMRSDAAPALSQSISPTWTGQHVFTDATQPLTLSSSAPQVYLIETDAAANNQVWLNQVDGEQYRLRACNSVGSGCTTFVAVDRTGNTVDSFAITATAATVNALPIVTEEQGTFTVSFGNACTTTPTITFDYTKAGNTVTVEAVSTTGFTCTGDTTSFSSGANVPANIRPAVAANSAVYANGGFQDNGVVTAGCIAIDSAGLMFLSKFNGTVCNATGWTASGNRSATIQNINFTYMLGNP